jgi:hypothetical protein
MPCACKTTCNLQPEFKKIYNDEKERIFTPSFFEYDNDCGDRNCGEQSL